jgi:Flp pilus assembly protein TadB
VTLPLFASLIFAAITAVSAAGLYLIWPRRMSPEEWIDRRHAAEVGAASIEGRRRRSVIVSAVLASWPVMRLRWTVHLIRADLDLLKLYGARAPASEEAMTSELLRLALLGAGAGLVAGIGLWALAGRDGLPVSTALFTVVCGALLPGLRWLRFRREAAQLRATIGRRLPRLLTGARVLLESGAVTPQQALTTVVSVYTDPAADVLREAMRDREVRRVELQASLDQVARTYRLEPLQRLADGLRIGTRFGTRMAELLTEYAADARQDWHTAYRERMVRAPVLMAVPALVFFVLPLLAVILLLVVTPLINGLGQL